MARSHSDPGKLNRFRALVVLAMTAVLGGAAEAQYWPLPAKTQNTDVPCSSCLGRSKGKLTKGYPAPISTFTGRFLDSSDTRDFQATFRTARAYNVQVMPALNRVYFRIGSAVFAYKLDTFLKRLESNEALVPSTTFPVYPQNQRSGDAEKYLQFDSYFYAEYGSGWPTITMDGQDRLGSSSSRGFDVDDKGYVYLAYTIFGWGIVKDSMATNGEMMATQSQRLGEAANLILSVKTSDDRYFALVSDQISPSASIFEVTDRNFPLVKTALKRGLVYYAKNRDGSRVAIIDSEYKLHVFTPDALVSNGAPLITVAPPAGGRFLGVASDGTNFFANTQAVTGGLTIASMAAKDGFQAKFYDTGRTLTLSYGFQYGGGYLLASGAVSPWDVLVWKVENDLSLTPVSFGNYFQNYYSYPLSSTYTVPTPAYTNITDAAIYDDGKKKYLFVCAKGLGDVYELSAEKAPTPPAAEFVYAPTTPAAARAVAFVDSSSGSPTSWSWSFGNGAVAQTQNPSYTFSAPGEYTVTLTAGNAAGTSTKSKIVAVLPAPAAVRGDANGDGAIAVTDAFYLINSLFSSGPAAPTNLGDANNDGNVTVTDVFFLINHLFAGGPAPNP